MWIPYSSSDHNLTYLLSPPSRCSLDKFPTGFTKAPLFWFELTNLALVQKPQITPFMDHNEGMCPGPVSLSLYSAV